MKVALTPEIERRLEQLRREVERLEVLHRNGIEFEVVDGFEALQETEKVEILERTARELTPDAILELLAFTIEICAVCQRIGASPAESLSSFVERLGAIARRNRSGSVH